MLKLDSSQINSGPFVLPLGLCALPIIDEFFFDKKKKDTSYSYPNGRTYMKKTEIDSFQSKDHRVIVVTKL